MKRIVGLILGVVAVAVLSGSGGKYPTAALTASPGDIIFSHKVHVDSGGIECSACHATIDTSTNAANQNYPSMDDCGVCHDAVQDDTQCGRCHVTADSPSGYLVADRPIVFNHNAHLTRGAGCPRCHGAGGVVPDSGDVPMPVMSLCLDCHDGTKAPDGCDLCHAGRITLVDIHSGDWRHQHGDRATSDRTWCAGCHRHESFCLDCHRGDNLDGRIHDLNYQYTHGLDAQSKAADCQKCHDRKVFCDGCHTADRRMPLRHSTVAWKIDHGAEARRDAESCAACHDASDPTCARGGCHNDADGIKGTNPRIHEAGGNLGSHGPWHSDDGYFCFQCHRNSRQAGNGFCGYCHDEPGE